MSFSQCHSRTSAPPRHRMLMRQWNMQKCNFFENFRMKHIEQTCGVPLTPNLIIKMTFMTPKMGYNEKFRDLLCDKLLPETASPDLFSGVYPLRDMKFRFCVFYWASIKIHIFLSIFWKFQLQRVYTFWVMVENPTPLFTQTRTFCE